MEHRCGLRRATRLRVTLRTLRGLPVDGQIVSLSGSGALVQCSLDVPINSTLIVHFDPRQTDMRMPSTARAEVIRAVQGGFAVEWEQFAPAAVRAALRYFAINSGGRREPSKQRQREEALASSD